MSFCSNCGKQIEDQAKFCSGCGKAIGDQQAPQANEPAAIQQPTTDLRIPQKDKLQTVDSGNGKRSEVYLSCTMLPSQAAQVAEEILTQNRFKPKDYKGEAVWKKGTGAATAMQFVKVEPFEDALGIQAWVQMGIGDIGLKEQSLDGFVGALPKKMLLKVVEQIQNEI